MEPLFLTITKLLTQQGLIILQIYSCLLEKKTSVKEAGTTSYFSAAITPTAITHHCNFKQTYINDTIVPVPTHLFPNKKNGLNHTHL